MRTDLILRIDRIVQAAVCALFLWALAAPIHFGATSSEGTRKTKAIHFMLETLVVETFRRPGGVVFSVTLELLAGCAIQVRTSGTPQYDRHLSNRNHVMLTTPCP